MIGLLGYGRIGKLLYKKLKCNYEIKIVRTIKDLEDVKTLIDFSSVDAKNIIECALNKGINVVMGTTGYTDAEINCFKEIAASKNIIFFCCCNYSLNIGIFYDMVSVLASKNIDLIEIHDISKKDYPSGTAIFIAKQFDFPKEKIISVRKVNENATHIVNFETEDEVITLSHKSKSKNAYVEGFIDFFKKLVMENDQRII